MGLDTNLLPTDGAELGTPSNVTDLQVAQSVGEVKLQIFWNWVPQSTGVRAEFYFPVTC